MKTNTILDKYFYYTGCILILCGGTLFLLLYLMDINPTHLLPPCAFHASTGYYCPGCGGTRAFLSLLHGDILASVCYHPIVLYTFAVGGWFMISQTIMRLSKNTLHIGMHIRSIYFYLALILTLINCIYKNYLVFIS